MQGRTFLVGLLMSIAAAATAADPPRRPSPEENILRKAGVAVDGDGLLTFFRERTLGDAETKRIGEIIKRLGADDFDDRERAAKELRKVGGRATPLVRAAAASADAEIAVRARAFLKEVDGPAVLPARGRGATAGPPRNGRRRAGAVELPPLRRRRRRRGRGVGGALLRSATPDGKADPALAAALDDPSPANAPPPLMSWAATADAGPAGRRCGNGSRTPTPGSVGRRRGGCWASMTGRLCRAWWTCWPTGRSIRPGVRRNCCGGWPATQGRLLRSTTCLRIGGSAATPGRRGGRTSATKSMSVAMWRRSGRWATRWASNTTPAASGNAISMARSAGRSASWRGRWTRRSYPTAAC